MDTMSYNRVSIEEISKNSDSYVIKSLLLSNYNKIKNYFTFEESFIFDGFMLGFCVKGSGKVQINFKEYELFPGSILLSLPNRIIKLTEKSEDFIMENLFLSFDLIIEFPSPKDFNIFDNVRKNPCVRVSEEMIHHLLEYHAFISEQYEEIDNVYREEIVKTLLYALILEISGIYKSNEDKGNDFLPLKHEELSDAFFRLLAKNYKTERSVAFYADKMCLTPKYLSSTIKKITGKTILSWINETVLIEAKVLLKTTDRNVIEISEDLNFPNPSFFGQFFKQHTGFTPLKYRNS